MAEEMKDAEFKEFLAQIRKDPADMSKLKTGMERFGMGYFTDSQKEAILKEIFPSPTPTKTPEKERSGFQDMKGIRNTLKAMQELHSEGKIDDTQMTAFLTMTNPETGNNVMTTIAIQTRATEFKRKHATDSNSQQKLDENLKIAADIQETLGEVKYHVLNTAINTPDSAKRPTKYADFADIAQKKKSIVFDTIKSVQAQRQLFPVVVPKKETELVKVEEQERGLAKVEDKERGLAETKNPKALTVDGAKEKSVKVGQYGEPLSVDGTPSGVQEPEDKNNVVTYEGDAGLDPKEGKRERPNGLGVVKEQDIIDYMFQNWFLGGVNLIMDAAYKIVDRGIDALCGNYENAPRSSGVASLGGGPARGSGPAPAGGGSRAADSGTGPTPSGDGPTSRGADSPQPENIAYQINALANQNVAGYLEVMQQLSGPYAAVCAEGLLKNIEKNIGKEASKWQCDEITLPNGKKATPLRPVGRNIEIINKLNAMKRLNPQAFDEKMGELLKNPQALAESMNPSQVRLASQLAVLDYVAAHPGAELEGNKEAQKKTEKDTLVKMTELSITAAQIIKNHENEYRLKHPEIGDRPFTDKEKKEIYGDATKEMADYLDTVTHHARGFKDALIAYHQDQSAENKKALDEAKKAYEEQYGKYLPDGKGHENDNNRVDTTGRDENGNFLGPINLKEAATQQNQFDAVVNLFNNENANDAAVVAGQQAELAASHQNLVERKNQILGNNSPQQVAQRAAQQKWFQFLGQDQGRSGK